MTKNSKQWSTMLFLSRYCQVETTFWQQPKTDRLSWSSWILGLLWPSRFTLWSRSTHRSMHLNTLTWNPTTSGWWQLQMAKWLCTTERTSTLWIRNSLTSWSLLSSIIWTRLIFKTMWATDTPKHGGATRSIIIIQWPRGTWFTMKSIQCMNVRESSPTMTWLCIWASSDSAITFSSEILSCIRWSSELRWAAPRCQWPCSWCQGALRSFVWLWRTAPSNL